MNLEKQAKSERRCSGLARAVIGKVVRSLYFSGAAIVITTLVSMFVAIFLNVVLRYFFESGITWAYELPAVLFPWCVAGGMVMASAQGRHIAVDVLVGILPEALQRMLAIAVNLFVSGMSVGVIYYSMPIIKASQYSRLAETGISQIYGYSSLVYAFSAIAILGVLTVLDYLLGRRFDAHDPSESHYS